MEILGSDKIVRFLQDNYSGLNLIETWGETTLFYNPEGALKRGIYFCTLKSSDGENDKGSHLDRPGVFRLNFGLSKKTFESLFHYIPKRPAKGGVIEGDYNFEHLNNLTPHPIYGWMCWVSILNPSQEGFEGLRDFLDESYGLCKEKYKKKVVESLA